MGSTAVTEVLRADGIRLDDMKAAIGRTGTRFVALLRELEPADAHRPVPNMTWTVGETAAHMLVILRRGTGDPRRSETLTGLAELNQATLEEIEPRDPAELADLIEDRVARLLAGLDGLTDDTARDFVVTLHAGVRADLTSAISYILCDLIGHGHDIAVATGRTWTIDPADAALDLHACIPLLVPWVKDDARLGSAQRTAVAFAADDDALLVDVGDGGFRANNVPRAEAPYAAVVDPVETFLAVCGRGSTADPTVARLAAIFEPI